MLVLGGTVLGRTKSSYVQPPMLRAATLKKFRIAGQEKQGVTIRMKYDTCDLATKPQGDPKRGGVMRGRLDAEPRDLIRCLGRN